MPSRIRKALLLALTLALATSLLACGDVVESEVIEGEPLELNGLAYKVEITRFLNPNDVEDAAYLKGLPEAPDGEDYLAVFMKIKNESEDPLVPTAQFEVIDTRENVFEPVEAETVFALDPTSAVEPDDEIPGPGTPAFNGPVKGGLILFLVDEGAVENRPLQLEVRSGTDTGLIELDI